MPVLVAISDLFFASKIDGVASAAGAAPQRASRGKALVDQVRELGPARVVVELGSSSFGGPAIEAVRAIKADPALAATEVVGYCRHTAVDLIREAKAAGCDRILTQGELAELLPALLAGDALPKGAASCD